MKTGDVVYYYPDDDNEWCDWLNHDTHDRDLIGIQGIVVDTETSAFGDIRVRFDLYNTGNTDEWWVSLNALRDSPDKKRWRAKKLFDNLAKEPRNWPKDY